MDDQATANTDREVWRGPDEGNGDFYADSVHITADGGISINVGGSVIVMPAFEWHALATGATRVVVRHAQGSGRKLPEKADLPTYPSNEAREWAADALSELRECNDRFCNESGYLLAQYFHLAFASVPAEGTPLKTTSTPSATPTADLLSLADEIETARENFLNCNFPSHTNRKKLEEVLWNDKGAFAPALRELAALRQSPAAIGTELPEWEDPQVQTVYHMLCDDALNEPPNPEEHWEGWISRNIVKALCSCQPDSVSEGELSDAIEEVTKNFGTTCDASDIARGLQAHFNVVRKP